MNVEQLPSTSKPLGLRKLRGRKGWEGRKEEREGERRRKEEKKTEGQAGNKSYTPERQTSRPRGTAQGQKLTKEALRDLRLMGWSKGGLLICSFSRYPSGILMSAGRDSRLFKSCTDGKGQGIRPSNSSFLAVPKSLKAKIFLRPKANNAVLWKWF